MSEKKELRKCCVEKMNALPQDCCREVDGRIPLAVLGLSEYRNVKTVFCFVGMQTETQTASLIEEMLRTGKQAAVPRCASKGVMHAHVIHSLAELRPGTMGILELSAEALVLPPEELDLILFPCVSTSRSGERFGYGGGLYDRHLPKIRAFHALLVREHLLSDDILREAHDRPVDAVIIEAGIFRRTQSENKGVS